MAHRIGDRNGLMLQQTLHGYSDGHRLLASSIDLPSRDAKTMLMMSDASGPAAAIGEEGYLTGYPLVESGHYALARTWPAPEMPRPGCVWTHTILVEFSDIPVVESVTSFLALFSRPRGGDQAYRTGLPYLPGSAGAAPPGKDTARRILFTVYSNPLKPVVSSSLSQRERDELVLAVWDQQWPRLKRAFRFCTLSFADRSSAAGAFDLQFLPATGRVPRAQFKAAVDADRQDFAPAEWLDDAVSDLLEGPGGGLRRFLRLAGSDVSGRESFAPLATLHALSTHFMTDPNSVEVAISVLDQTLPETKGQAARALIARAAAGIAGGLGPPGLQFVVHNFDLIQPNEADVAAEGIGRALWEIDPNAVVDLLDDPERRLIAERAIASLPAPALLQGASSAPGHLRVLLSLRPDLATEPGYWSFRDTWNSDALLRVAERPETVPGAVDAMIRSKQPLIHMARAAFGTEIVLRRIVSLIESADIGPETATAWLSQACADREALAHILSDGSVERPAAMDAIARAATPDLVRDDFGEDPWVVASRRVAQSDMTPYLATFLLTRAFGPSTRGSAELIQLAFDTVYAAVELSTLPEDAWRLLDPRLYWSYLWPNWDRCLRIRQTTVAAFVERGLDRAAFARITGRDEVFSLLVELATFSSSGRKYLKSVKDRLARDADQPERLRLVQRVPVVEGL